MASCHPQPRTTSSDKPVYSCHRRFQNIPVPSGKLHHASVGIVSMIFRSLASKFRISSKAHLNVSCDLSLDGDYGDVTCAFDQPQVSLTRGAGLCVVHPKRAEHMLVFGK